MRNLIILVVIISCAFTALKFGSFRDMPEPVPQPHVAQENGEEMMDIKEFVVQPFIHGVPYDEAVKYDAAATVPVLIQMLKDPNYAAARSQIATTLGMLGSPEAVEPLIELAETDEGELSPTEYNAKTGAIGALGLILNRKMNDRAFSYLKGLAVRSPLTISKMKWMSPFEETIDEKNVELARTAIIALGLSGQKKAKDFLKSLQNITVVPPTLPAELKESVDLTRKEALVTNEAIQNGKKEGLKNYFNKVQ